MPTPQNFDEYLATVNPELKPKLLELREYIKRLIPQAEEKISYQVPCYRLNYYVVGIGVTKQAISLYTMNPGLVKQMKEELKGHKVSGATIHFNPNEKLPKALIKQIVKARVKEDQARAAAKKK